MVKRKRRGSQNAGRPRKEGPRLPNGRLAPPEPNARVVAERRALLGDDSLDLATASDPLDFALAKGFITMQRYRAAMTVAQTYDRAQLGAPGAVRAVHEAQPTQAGETEQANHPNPRNEWDAMGSKTIVRAFDAVFNVTGDDEEAQDARGTKAMARWKAIAAALDPAEFSQVYEVCILRSWPQWVILKARRAEVPEVWDRRRRLLEAGLDKVAALKVHIFEAQ